jgi:hypothetical protein
MKKIIEKAKQYESKKSLDGKMKFLKGNVGKVVKDSVNKKTKSFKSIKIWQLKNLWVVIS